MARTKLKKLSEGSEMPYDFWNYLVNPITGYYVEPQGKHNRSRIDLNKYHTTPVSVK